MDKWCAVVLWFLASTAFEMVAVAGDPSLAMQNSIPIVNARYVISTHKKTSSPLLGMEREQQIETKYESDEDLASGVEAVTAGKMTIKMARLFKKGEMIRSTEVRENGEIKHTELMLVLPDVPKIPVLPSKGEVFALAGDCLPVGCVDGYFLSEYFPDSGGRVEETPEQGILHVVSQGNAGSAEAWIDVNHGHLPVRFIITKGPEDLTTELRTVKDVLYDTGDAKSALTAVVAEASDIVVDKTESGQYYIKEATLKITKTSSRGLEEQSTAHSVVESVSAIGGHSRPDIPVKDNQLISVENASQLAYKWSVASNWAVPASSELAAGDPANSVRRKTWFTYVLALNGAILVIGVIVFALGRRP